MSETSVKQKEQASNVLSDFKKAAHALLDAIELGFFKRVEVNSNGSINRLKEGPIGRVEFLNVERSKNGVLHISLKHFQASSSILAEWYLEELVGKMGMFLDEKDARRLQLQENIESLKRDKAQFCRRAEEAQEEINNLELEIAKLS